MRLGWTGHLVALTALLAGPAALAQTQKQIAARYTPAYNRCMKSGDAAQGVDPAMQACTDAETGRQDDRLNKTYQAVMARLDARGKADLKARERAWIPTRDKACTAQAKEEEGGTLANLLYAGCMLDETIKRTLWLEAYKPKS